MQLPFTEQRSAAFLRAYICNVYVYVCLCARIHMRGALSTVKHHEPAPYASWDHKSRSAGPRQAPF